MTTITHQQAVNATFIFVGVTLFTMPDLVFGLVTEILHLGLEVAHLLFEFLEIALDHVIEHLFETEVHETQVIVFYIIVSMAAVSAFFIFRGLRKFFTTAIRNIITAYGQTITDLKSYWQGQSLIGKFKLISISSTGIVLFVMFGF
jgi:hypothetical protein